MGGWSWGPGEIRQTPQPGLQVSQKKQESSSPHYGSSHLSPLTLPQHCQETPPRPHSSLSFVSGLTLILTLAISADSARSRGLGSSWWAGNYGEPLETQHPSALPAVSLVFTSLCKLHFQFWFLLYLHVEEMAIEIRWTLGFP